MYRRFTLYKCSPDAEKTYITWLTAGTIEEARDTVRWFGRLQSQSGLFRLSKGEFFQIEEAPADAEAGEPAPTGNELFVSHG